MKNDNKSDSEGDSTGETPQARNDEITGSD
jgi:hypothetical protein